VGFSEAMDQLVSPAPASFEVLHDAVDNPVASANWVGPQSLLLVGTPGVEPAAVTIELLKYDFDLRNLASVEVAPFGPYAATH